MTSTNDNNKSIAIEFQNELNTITDNKPPVSKAKMSSIVKEALKSLKNYKHVVYYVETFIKNCENDYKLAGLYIIDAIIRHSRNQHGNNDLYAPRFAKNLIKTFNSILKCSLNEKEKVNKVLQIWSKNQIFSDDLLNELNLLLELSKKEPTKDDKLFNNEQLDQLKSLNSSNLDKIDEKILTQIHDLTSKILNKSTNSKQVDKNSPSELNSPTNTTSTSDRLETSLKNCSAWLETNGESIEKNKEIFNFDKIPNLTNEQKEIFSNIYQYQTTTNQNNDESPLKRPHSPIIRIDNTKRKKGYPIMKDKHLCIISKTLWIGHLSKQCSEKDLKENLNDFGKINDIHLIPPRGCAYIQFDDRFDAFKCLDKMKDSKINGNSIKIAWAQNKGIKDALIKNKNNYWDIEQGCTYIPWNELLKFDKIKFDNYIIGGCIDELTIPDSLKILYNSQVKKIEPLNDTPKMVLQSNQIQIGNQILNMNQPPPSTLQSLPPLPLQPPATLNLSQPPPPLPPSSGPSPTPIQFTTGMPIQVLSNGVLTTQHMLPHQTRMISTGMLRHLIPNNQFIQQNNEQRHDIQGNIQFLTVQKQHFTNHLNQPILPQSSNTNLTSLIQQLPIQTMNQNQINSLFNPPVRILGNNESMPINDSPSPRPIRHQYHHQLTNNNEPRQRFFSPRNHQNFRQPNFNRNWRQNTPNRFNNDFKFKHNYNNQPMDSLVSSTDDMIMDDDDQGDR